MYLNKEIAFFQIAFISTAKQVSIIKLHMRVSWMKNAIYFRNARLWNELNTWGNYFMQYKYYGPKVQAISKHYYTKIVKKYCQQDILLIIVYLYWYWTIHSVRIHGNMFFYYYYCFLLLLGIALHVSKINQPTKQTDIRSTN